MVNNKKGQTAMEYLMTYGWAIIIVVIVGVALWRLGVFTPGAGSAATGFEEFSVDDHIITNNGTATVVLKNVDRQSRTTTFSSVTVDGQACTGATGDLQAGSSATATCTGVTSGSAGTPYTGIDVQIGYTVNSVAHTETGKISGRYE